MNEQQINLLWADDECEGLLEPLGGRFEREGFRLWKGLTYTDAMTLLHTKKIDSLLVDIILPHASGIGTLGFNLGLELADLAAKQGVKSIVFLTVVLEAEVAEKYEKLKKTYPHVNFKYEDKLLLLEPNIIEDLIDSLKPSKA